MYSAEADDPPFFRTPAWKAHLRPDDNVMTVPTYGRGSRWAARTDIGFRMAGGYVGSLPTSYTRFRAFRELSPLPSGVPVTEAEFRRFIEAKGVTAVVVEEGENPGLQRLLVRSLARTSRSATVGWSSTDSRAGCGPASR